MEMEFSLLKGDVRKRLEGDRGRGPEDSRAIVWPFLKHGKAAALRDSEASERDGRGRERRDSMTSNLFRPFPLFTSK